MSSISKWHILRTKPRWEKKVGDLLERKGIEVYVPLNKILRKWADRKKVVFEPLFSSFVFVRFKQKEEEKVMQTDGTLGFIYWKNEPVGIENEVIETIKKILYEYDNVHLEKTEVNPNEKIGIVDKQFVVSEGKVVEFRNDGVQIIIPSLGFILIAQVGKKLKPALPLPIFRKLNNDSLGLIFNKEEFNAEEIAEIISVLSELYKSVGGDELRIQSMDSFELIREYKIMAV